MLQSQRERGGSVTQVGVLGVSRATKRPREKRPREMMRQWTGNCSLRWENPAHDPITSTIPTEGLLNISVGTVSTPTLAATNLARACDARV